VIPLFGPGWGNYAIRGIVEVRLPDAVSLQPETPGWWILLALLLYAAGHRAWRSWNRYRRNRYRREALLQLQTLHTRYRQGDRECLRELAPLLRATVLQAVGNRSLASARGDDWHRALQQLAPDVAPPPVVELDMLAYAPLADTADHSEALFDSLRLWIQRHEHSDA
jgi:hypothetical protein